MWAVLSRICISNEQWNIITISLNFEIHLAQSSIVTHYTIQHVYASYIIQTNERKTGNVMISPWEHQDGWFQPAEDTLRIVLCNSWAFCINLCRRFFFWGGGAWWSWSQSNDCKAKAMRDGQGSPPRQWEKKQHPLTNNTAWLISWLCMCVCVCMCVCMYMPLGAWKSSLQAKGCPS